eukprot:SAG31_NODE_435_length_15733_cov_6.508251_11_plen_284_part_00
MHGPGRQSKLLRRYRVTAPYFCLLVCLFVLLFLRGSWLNGGQHGSRAAQDANDDQGHVLMAGTGAKGMPADDSSSCLLLDCLQSVPQARELVFQALGPLDLLRLADVRTGSRQLRHWGQATLNGPNMTQLAMVGGLVRTLPPVLPPRRHVRADQITSSDDDDDQSSEDDQSSGSDGSEFDSNSLSSDHSDGSEGSTGGSELDEHDNGDTINRSRDRGEEGSQNGEEQARRSVARSEYSGNEQRPGDYIVEWGGTPSGIVSVFEWSSGRWVRGLQVDQGWVEHH